MHVTIQIDASHVAALVAAISHLVPEHQIGLYEQVALPAQPPADEVDELAHRIAVAIRPIPAKPMRREALQKLFNRHDTFWDQQGEPDPSLRNAMGSISKDLKSIFAHDKPIQRLAIPRKTRMDDGSYQGTVYEITSLGARVYEILKTEGYLT